MKETYSVIARSINGRMLWHAFGLMHSWVADVSDPLLSDRLQSLEKNYRMIADWFLSGKEDPHRNEVVTSLARETMLLLDELYLRKRMKDSTSYEFVDMHRPVSGFSNAEEAFRYFWLRRLEEWDHESFLRLVSNPEMEDEALMAVSGLTLNLLRSFSLENTLCLMHAAEEQYAECIRERAWVGLLLVLMVHDNHLGLFPEVQEALLDLTSTEDGRVFACTALTCIVRTLGVEWASESYKDLQTKLTPLVQKLIPDMTGQNVILPDQMAPSDDPVQKEMNDVIDAHRREMMRLYNARLDTNFSMFKDMYGTSFFKEPYRWWLPFAPDYLPEDMKGAEKFLSLMPAADMCDSDCYAFISSMAKVGKINGHSIDEVLPADGPMREDRDRLLTNDYVCQAYRFFKLNPWKIDSPFDSLAVLETTEVFRLLNPSAVEKSIIAEHCFRCHAWKQAAAIYEIVADSLSASGCSHYAASLCELGRLEEAAKLYQRALELEDEDDVRERLCQCYEKLDRLADALMELEVLLLHDPRNQRYLYMKALLLAKSELFAEALDTMYQLLLYYPEDQFIEEDLASVALNAGDLETSEKYFQRVLNSPYASSQAYMNYAHLCFIQGKRLEAFEYYQKCMRTYSSLRDFLSDFRPGRKDLLEHGVQKSDIYLMEDQLIMIYSNQ